ncbi:MAG: hypothetical protein WC052_02610 [Patescibacteria group bacterium]
MSMFKKEHRRGFGILEILIVAGIVALIIPSMFQFGFFMTAAMNRRSNVVEATYIAEEGIEAIRTIRDRGWSTEIFPLANGTVYYPVIQNNNWTVTTTNPGPVQGIYTRTVTFAAVQRDGSDNITSSGATDSKTRLVTAVVSWSDAGQARAVTLETYITDFKGN